MAGVRAGAGGGTRIANTTALSIVRLSRSIRGGGGSGSRRLGCGRGGDAGRAMARGRAVARGAAAAGRGAAATRSDHAGSIECRVDGSEFDIAIGNIGAGL